MDKDIVDGVLEKGQEERIKGKQSISDGHDSERIWDPEKQRYVEAYRKVFADALGISVNDIPDNMYIHHIDGDRMNNDIDNLMLCTKKAHEKLEMIMDPHHYDPE